LQTETQSKSFQQTFTQTRISLQLARPSLKLKTHWKREWHYTKSISYDTLAIYTVYDNYEKL